MKDQPLADLQLATQRILGGERWISSSLVSKLAQQRTVPAASATIWLTRRQRELLRVLTQGMDNRHIAQVLDLSVKTVENHLTALYRVLGVDSRIKALHYALHHPELLAISGQETREFEPFLQQSDPDLSVLVVDDNIRYRQQITRLIGRICPASVFYEAGNISEAINLGQQIRPQLAIIDVVLDNLTPHTKMTLLEIFGKTEGDRIGTRLQFHYTPLHRSWLNMAEIELSVMERQCLKRRLGNEFTRGTELIAWEKPRNDAQVKIRWKFTKDDARRVFAKYYPTPQN